MASGIVHAKVARNVMYVTWVGSTFLTAYELLSLESALGLSVGALAGYLVTPDSDIENPTYEDARVYFHWGKAMGVLWEGFWGDYARKYSHRGISHKPFRGTASRWAYVSLRLVIPFFIALTMFMPEWLFSLEWTHVYYGFKFSIASYVMHSIQDIIHLKYDGWKYHENV